MCPKLPRNAPPNRRSRRLLRPSDAGIVETALFHIGFGVDVSEVDHDIAIKQRFGTFHVECAELVPFGDDHHGIGALERVIWPITEHDIREKVRGLFHAFRVKGANGRSGCLQERDDVEAWCIAHVIGVLLEGEAQNTDRLAGDVSAHSVDHLLRHGFLAGSIYLDNRVDDPDRCAMIIRGFGKGERIFREAGATIAGTRVEELLPDPVIKPDPA